MPDQPTADPYVVIEAHSANMVRYRRTTDGRRWEVHGTCDHRGDCVIGAWLTNELGQPELIQSVAQLQDLIKRLGAKGVFNQIDVPVTPEFNTCCGGAGLFTYTELTPAP